MSDAPLQPAQPRTAVTDGLPAVKDRLTTTLFLAALFHGVVILGVTFAVPHTPERRTPTLEVLLLTGQDAHSPDNPDAQYLAQRSQQGGGTTDERVRPANPASSAIAAQQAGTADGDGAELREAVDGRRTPEVLSARSDRSEVDYRSGDERPAQDAQTPLALSPDAPSPVATHATDRTLQLRGQRPDGQYEIVPNTRESELAPYLDAWRRKIERLGTLNFPQTARGRHAGNPVLEVALRPDGALSQVVIRRSSGRKDIDQAALAILRLASPFDPFPQALRSRYEELRFAYEWQFLAGEGG
ncbi:MAG TPA: TonB family protein [Steroidobacter sp.]|jgi:protein TonB|nr:TonB family protein [Steroidobacteraceae bacterium]HLS82181.1 TonB family protein [Steroidobacter sp.]